MLVLALDTAPQPPSVSDLLRALLVPVEARPAGELGSGALENQLRAIYSARPAVADTWLAETLGYLQQCGKYQDGWDGDDSLAPSPESLKTAEYLTAFFATWSNSRRPTLAIDMRGQPTFASKSKDFYLHLTVDGQDRLTWYAVTGSQEHIETDVPFDGTSMPPDLANLAS